MIAYILRRLIGAVGVMLGVVAVIFIVVRLVPGDPVQLMLGPDASPEELAAARSRLGLDRPLIAQFGSFIADAIRLDFGTSIRSGLPGMELVAVRLPTSVKLAVVAMTFAIIVSFPIGIRAGLHPNGRFDRWSSILTLATQSAPGFWIGLMSLLLFSRSLHLLPSAGDDTLLHFVQPAVVLSLPLAAVLIRLIRTGLIEVARKDYVRTARAHGLPERVVVTRHMVRNMLLPVVTVAGLQFGNILGGAVIVETIFAWPGVGRLLVDAINGRDYAVVQAATFVIAGMFVAVNLLVDIGYGFLDPRARVADR